MLWKKLSQFHLGLQKGHVELVEHDTRWAEAFSLVVDEIQSMIPHSICECFHIGSTSIPSICAKPVLDILGVTPSLKEFDDYQRSFEELGFTWKGEFGIPGRRYSPLYDQAGLTAFVHLHVFQKDAPEVQSHLKFCEALRSNPSLALEYDLLKRSAATLFKDQREKYTTSKGDFIQRISR